MRFILTQTLKSFVAELALAYLCVVDTFASLKHILVIKPAAIYALIDSLSAFVWILLHFSFDSQTSGAVMPYAM